MSSKRILYPMSLSNPYPYVWSSPRRNTTGTGMPGSKQVYTFKPETYSFEIDNQDEALKHRLRRKSYTGETPHPILRQLSDGRVSIPVEHVDEEDDFKESETISASRITQPERVELSNSARKKIEQKRQKAKDPNKSETHQNYYGRPSYDPKNYEEQWSLKNQPPAYNTVATEKTYGNKDFESDFQNLKIDEKKVKSNKKTKEEIRKEHEEEIRKQDEYMKGNYSLHRFYIIPDGNCLYRAVAQAILLNQTHHMTLRQLATDHIREHKDEFKDIIEGDIDVFLATAQVEGEWAGYPEILALSRLLDININITMGGTPSNPEVHLRLHFFETPHETGKPSSPAKNNAGYTQRESIWLSWLTNGHYDMFTEKKLENPAYEKWLRSRESTIESDYAMANQIYLDDANRNFMYENAPKYESVYPATSQESSRSPTHNRDFAVLNNSNINDGLHGHANNSGPSSSYDYASNVRRSSKSSSPDRSRSSELYDYADDVSVPPQVYPDATYDRRSPRSATESPPPAYSTVAELDTDRDAELAMSLQREEVEHACERRTLMQRYYGHDYV